MFDLPADFEPAVVVGHGEVAADVVQLGRRDVGLECLGWRLGVERLAVDHRQCRAFAFQIVCQSHFGPPRWASCRGLVVGILEGGVSVLVERADALDPVGVDRRAPVGFHHDRDRLLGRLPLAKPDSAFHGLHGGR